MSNLTKVEELKTKRFVIRKSLIGKNVVISLIVQRIHPLLLSYLILHYNNVELIC